MILHLGFELPERHTIDLDDTSSRLNPKEVEILKDQIRKNGRMIDVYLQRLDLFVNREGYPQKAVFLEKIRHRLDLLMTENDTFRSVLWKHYQKENLCKRQTR